MSSRVGLRFRDCPIEVESNSRALIEHLTDYFHDFVTEQPPEPAVRVSAVDTDVCEPDMDFTIKEPDPGKSRIKEEYVDLEDGRIVRKRLTGMLFLLGQGIDLACGPCLENDNQVINFINNRFIEWTLKGGSLLCHAAGVSVAGRGLAIAGSSGAGKSTLALQVMDGDIDYVSNDRLMVRRDGDRVSMVGVPKLPRVNPGTILHNPSLHGLMDEESLREAASLPQEELWELEDKYDVSIERFFGPNRFKLEARMKGLVLLNWEPGDAPLEVRRVDLCDEPELLEAFMKSAGVFYDPEEDYEPPSLPVEDYIHALEPCEVFELAGGARFDEGARACATYLRTGRMQTR